MEPEACEVLRRPIRPNPASPRAQTSPSLGEANLANQKLGYHVDVLIETPHCHS